MKLLEKDIGETFLNIGMGTIFGEDPESISNKRKNRQMRLHQTKKPLNSNGNNHQSKENGRK